MNWNENPDSSAAQQAAKKKIQDKFAASPTFRQNTGFGISKAMGERDHV